MQVVVDDLEHPLLRQFGVHGDQRNVPELFGHLLSGAEQLLVQLMEEGEVVLENGEFFENLVSRNFRGLEILT